MRLPRVVGHRGALDLAPENTIAGIRRAAALGVTGVEFDVKLTADGQCIVFHDDRLERTTDGSGTIANTPFETIAALDAGAWFAPEFVGERVPRLEEVIAELVALDLYPDIEIKPCPGREIETARAALTTIKSHWPSGRDGPLLTSFALPCLEVARDLAPAWPRGLICLKPPADWPIKVSSVDATVLVCHENGLLQNDVEAFREQGIAVVTYPINDGAYAARLMEWGVSSLISNSPDRLLAATSPVRP